ncbi:MAG: hypothetical protein IPL27_19630 [Lewinellaceae bacterium]|nr:hypothetical protein [Lewinellaceae bacterium]
MRLILLLFAIYLPQLAVPAAAQAQQVKTGIYLMNLYNLNMDEHSFYADFYIWFRWSGPIDPTNIEFVNAIENGVWTRLLSMATARPYN